MKNPSIFVFGVLLTLGCWFFFEHFEIKGLDDLSVARKNPSQQGGLAPLETQPALSTPPGDPPPGEPQETIRIASFNIQVFGEAKMSKPHVVEHLTRIIRRFDLVAIQEIRAKDQNLLPEFVRRLNASGRHYQYRIGPRLGNTVSKEQYAFLFDAATIETDPRGLYTVNDRDNYLHREPLVGWFRARGPAPDQAFTFTVINMHTDPDEVEEELSVMDDVFYVVQNDARREDDVILLGDLNTDTRRLGDLGRLPNIYWAINEPTNTLKTRQLDHILFDRRATSEFTNRSGVFDLMGELNLSLREAQEISDHMPVWAEFSVYEGGRSAVVAGRR